VFDITSGWLNAYTGKYYSSFASGVTGFHHRACHVEMAFENMFIFTDHEPYFDGQPLTELGYSMEDAVSSSLLQ
jgi:hypothetical protein